MTFEHVGLLRLSTDTEYAGSSLKLVNISERFFLWGSERRERMITHVQGKLELTSIYGFLPGRPAEKASSTYFKINLDERKGFVLSRKIIHGLF